MLSYMMQFNRVSILVARRKPLFCSFHIGTSHHIFLIPVNITPNQTFSSTNFCFLQSRFLVNLKFLFRRDIFCDFLWILYFFYFCLCK